MARIKAKAIAATATKTSPPLTPAPAWAALFGRAPVITGEDPESYNSLAAQVTQALRPTSFIEQMVVKDVVDLHWEENRYQRAKTALLQRARADALTRMLVPALLDEGSAPGVTARDAAGALAANFVAGDPAAHSQVLTLLASQGMDLDTLIADVTVKHLDQIERLDDLITRLHARRLAVLRQLDIHRDSVQKASGRPFSDARLGHRRNDERL